MGNVTDFFNGKIGKNIPPTLEEQEEDLLETCYALWKNGMKICVQELLDGISIPREDLYILIRQMIRHGYLKGSDDGVHLELTSYGKTQGAECLDRHQYLTQFLQMTCGLNEQHAEENACRIEHVIDGEVMQGIRDFLKFGDPYDRVVSDMNMHVMYENGSYWFRGGIYCIEKRYPRILAEEFYFYSDEILLEVGEKQSFFYLHEQSGGPGKCLWYKDEKGWRKAQITEKGFRVPADVFSFAFSPSTPITEADGMIAFTDDNCLPEEEDCREWNIHLW